MIEIMCDPVEKTLTLDLTNNPLCVSLDPFIGETRKELKLGGPSNFEAVCIHLEKTEDLFLKPFYTSNFLEIPENTSIMIMRQDVEYFFFYCLSHEDQKISLSGNDEGITLHAKCSNASASKTKRPALVALKGTDLYEIIERGIQYSLELSSSTQKSLKEKSNLPSWLQRLGWESGSSSRQDCSHEKIIKTVSSLLNAGCNLGFVLINEGWQDMENGQLKSFDADFKRFPKDLKGLIDELNALGIKHVGVFHRMMGCNKGIHEDLAKSYNLQKDLQGRYFLGKTLGDTFEFFYNYHADLKKQGVTFIKVGDQATPKFALKNLHAAIQGSASIHFNTNCLLDKIACDNDKGLIENFGLSIRNNLVNSLWMQHLMLPDFDAWTTTHEHNEIFAILHALSGSINVISDIEGHHDQHLVKKMMLPCGKILRSDKPLTLCLDCIFIDPLKNKKIYKAFTKKGETGVVATFNLTEEKCTLKGFVSPSDITGLSGDKFALLSHHKGFIGCFNLNDKIEITLKPKGADVLTFAPVRNGIAVLGCYNFFLTAALITEVNIEDDSMHISTDTASPMMIYCEREIFEVRRNGHAIPWEYNEKRKILCIDTRSNFINEHSAYTIIFE